jgi:tetratricopeptide (TPR) repeat protein
MKIFILSIFLAHFSSSVFSQPNKEKADSLYNIAKEFLYKAKYQDCKNYCDSAIKFDSTQFWYYSTRASAKENLNDIKGALLDYNKSIKLDSTIAVAYYLRGLLYYLRLKNKRAAYADLKMAADLGYFPAKDYLQKHFK